jgi:hypothetical protein
MTTYHIIRFYAPHLNKSAEHGNEKLTLEEAQEHCKDERTHVKGEWFDGYTEN